MFENYSLADLFANIYKKLKLNIILTVVLYIILVLPILYNTVRSNKTIIYNPEFSSYVSYKIEINDNLDSYQKVRVGGYSDYYYNLVKSNINGAFLFNDISSDNIEKYALELGIDTLTLKKSNKDFWDKKILVNPLEDNKGITLQILTLSKDLNLMIENKVDDLIKNNRNVYKGVSIEKLSTVYSSLGEQTLKTNMYDKKALIIKIFLLFIMSFIIVCSFNFIRYIFNPTINRISDYYKYKDIKKVFNIKSNEDIAVIKELFSHDVTFITTVDNIVNKIKKLGYNIIKLENLDQIKNNDNFLFIEEYGITKYKNFGRIIIDLNNFEKNILGVISYKL